MAEAARDEYKETGEEEMAGRRNTARITHRSQAGLATCLHHDASQDLLHEHDLQQRTVKRMEEYGEKCS